MITWEPLVLHCLLLGRPCCTLIATYWGLWDTFGHHWAPLGCIPTLIPAYQALPAPFGSVSGGAHPPNSPARARVRFETPSISARGMFGGVWVLGRCCMPSWKLVAAIPACLLGRLPPNGLPVPPTLPHFCRLSSWHQAFTSLSCLSGWAGL